MPTEVTQLEANPDGTITGRNNCWEACLASELEDHPTHNIPTDARALLKQISLTARGVPDREWQPPTTLAEAAHTLDVYGITYRWTDTYALALEAADSICLVDGTKLAPAQYPAAWFGGEAGQPNHFVRWLPAINGQDNWFMDPLTQELCRYDLAAVAASFAGAYILTWPGITVSRPCAVKPEADHSCGAIAHLATGTAVEELGPIRTNVPLPFGQGGENWTKVKVTEGGMVGWVPMKYLAYP